MALLFYVAILGRFSREKWNQLSHCMPHCFRNDAGQEKKRVSLCFPKRQVLEPSILKEFAEDKFKSDENEGSFFKWVENTVEKGEIACY